MKDLFGNTKPIQIEDGEWWFNGNFIQKQSHPLLSKYIIWKDKKEVSMFVHTAATFKEATGVALNNECYNPDYLPKHYL